MKKLIILIFFMILLFSSVFLNLVFAGSSDFWLECNSTLANCNNQYHYKNGYYCCSTGGGYVWQNNECSYCSCSRKKPSVDIIPSSKSGSKGEKLTYTVNVTNNDNTPCGSSSFTLAVSSCPQNWNCKLSTTQLTISPDQKGSTNIDVTSSASASDGTYTFKVNATNTNSQLSGEGSANYVISTTANPPTTTTIPQGTTTTTTTIPSSGCGNGKCDYPTETQANCPQDCKTVLTVYTKSNEIVTQTTSLMPNQQVRINLTFNDSRYNSNQGFNLRLDATIDGNPWTIDNGCKACYNKLSDMGCDSSKRGDKKNCTSDYYNINVYMENGYAKIEFNATLPGTLTPGTHKIKITPILLSSPVTLRAAEAQFKVGDGFYTFVFFVKQIFNKLTGLFIL